MNAKVKWASIGLLLCVILGYFMPVSDANTADPENVGGKVADNVETKTEAKPPESSEELVTLRLRDLGISLKDPNASAED